MNRIRIRPQSTLPTITLILALASGIDASARQHALGKQTDQITTLVASAIPGSTTQTGNGETRSGVLSGDGRYVVFMSTSTNLGFTDTNNVGLAGTDLFMRDLDSGDLTLVTHAAGQPGTTGNGLFSFAYDISSDGRYVVYNSQGTNLVAGQNDLNGPPDGLAAATDLFLHDRTSGESVLVSHAFGAPSTTGDRSSNIAAMSGDGRFVVFESQATNLVDGFTEGNGESEPDVYIYEIATGDVSLVSHAPGIPAAGSDGASRSPKISDDGRYVVFESTSTDLVTGFSDADPGMPTAHVYVYDRVSGETRLVSHAVGSSETGGDAPSGNAEVSGDGRFISFRSEASDLVTGYVGTGSPQIFVYDRIALETALVSHVPGQPTTASNGFSGNAWISADGRWIVHSTGATNLVSGQNDTNDASDLFMYDRVDRSTTLISHAAGSETTTADGFAGFGAMSTDGRFVAYWGPATNLVDGQIDNNGNTFLGIDTFLWDRLTGESILLSNEAGSPTTVDPTGDAYARSMATDGSAVLFSSTGTGYVAGQTDTNNEEDVFVSLIDTTPPPPPGCDLVVTNTANSGAGSLRQAILDANASAGLETICFAIDGDGPHTIAPTSLLPTITDPVVIDGYSQPGSSPNTNPTGALNTVLMIELSGHMLPPDVTALFITAGGSTVRGLAINRFDNVNANGGYAIWLNTNGNNRVEGCFLGTDPSGTMDRGNGNDAIFILNGSSSNVIGGTTPAARNLISGNDRFGVFMFGSGVTANVVQGNLIGTDVTGMSALGNEIAGVYVDGAPGNTIGGTGDGEGNLISGNVSDGITIINGASDTLVEGNWVGTDATGLAALANGGNGVRVYQSSGTMLGGSQPGAANVISGNGDDGVDLFGAESRFNELVGNLIGVGSDGRTAMGNAEDGVDFGTDPSFNTVSDNVISANAEWGFRIDSGTSDTQVFRNYIGTNAEGDELGNGFGGILVEDAGPQIIGGTYGDAGECCEGNTIAYNGGPGVGVDVTQTISHEKGIRGNRIFANEGLGIDLELDGVTANDPQDADGAGAANALQNYPVLDVPQSGVMQLTGMLNSVPSSSFRVDVYRSSICDASGYGEGEVFLGTVDVMTDASGNAPITFDLDVQTGPGEFYTATAIDAQANTSEFSACVEPDPPVNAPPSASEVTAPADGATVVVGGTGPDDAGDPNDIITIGWTESVDPEGADVTHTWQLSAAEDFSTLLLEVDAGQDTQIDFTLAELAAVLDGAGVEQGAGVLLYHRVIASDGALETTGPAAEATLVRGTLAGEGNAPPSAAVIVSPADGERVVVGGTVRANASDPGAMRTFTWDASVDPEGADVTHIWQLSLDESFSEPLLEFNAGPEIDASYTVGELAPILDDAGLTPGVEVTAWHRVISSDGVNETIGPVFEVRILRGTITNTDAAGETPDTYALHAAYPNPFNPSTTIGYSLPESGQVRLGVFDLLGREVRVLVDGIRAAGDHRAVFDAASLPSGIYLVRMETAGNTLTRQVTLMK